MPETIVMEETELTESRHRLPFSQHHAFIIGIDEYEKVSPLQTAVNDARRLAEVLTMQQHFTVHPPLLNAKGDEIRTLLQQTLQSVGKDDRVVFYFAGHGIAADGDDGPAGYIVPADADPTNVKTFIPMEDLHKTLDELPCRHVLLILDCCFSGAFKWSSQFRAIGTLMPKRIYKERFDRFVMDPAWQVITSAAYDQKALDVLQGKATGDRGIKKSDNSTPHSPFALALFEGLAGAADAKVEQEGDGVITATELYSYIRDQIEPATIEESQKLRQTPGFFPLRKHDKGEFIFLHPRHRLNLPLIPSRSPYKGLQSFDESDKELFYGRDRVVKELRDKVAGNKLIVVSGASGTGKSSVIKAGLLPQLSEDGFHVLPVIRPGIHPMTALEKTLRGTGSEQFGGRKTVLFIDQYEELATDCNDAAERNQFVAQLCKMLDESPADGLKIILAVRADFESQFDNSDLEKYWIAGRYAVPPFSVEELKEVIVMPTIQEVLIFDPPELVEAIIEEVVQAPGAVPLLEQTLGEFYETYRTSGRQDRALKKEEYDKLGGVMGTLRKKADALYQSLDTGSQNTMRKVMLRMVSLEEGLSGKRVPMDELLYADPEENNRVRAMIDRLVEARLIVKGKDYIELAHDALVREWKTLLDWIHTIGEDHLLLNSKLNAAANEFAHSQNVRFLWNDNPHLSVLQQELLNPRQWFNGKEITFIQQSIQRKRKLSRIVRAITAGVVIALSGLTVWALISRHIATQNYKTAKTNLLSIRATEVLKTDMTKSLRLAEAAYAIFENDPPAVAQQILSEAFHTLHDSTAFYSANFQHGGEVTSASFSPGRDRILTTSMDHTAVLWDLQGNPLDTLEHTEEVTGSEFSRSGKHILTVTIDGTVWLWDSTGTRLNTMLHAQEIYSAVFSPGEEFILTACKDDTARVWNLRGTLIATLPHSSEVFSAVFDSAGQHILTASADNTAKLWDLKGHLLKTFRHNEQVNEAIFSPDGGNILTSSRDKTAVLWDLQGSRLSTFRHSDEVLSASFAPDGQSILTASADSTAKLWTLHGEPMVSFDEHHEVTRATFSADGQNILTASKYRRARLWNLRGELIAMFAHPDEVTRAVFSANGTSILTASKDSTAKLWDLRALRLRSLARPANWAAVAPNGERILTLSDDHVTRLWDVQGSLVDSLTRAEQIAGAVFSPDSEHVLLFGEDHFAGLWNVRTKQIDTLAHDHDVRSAMFSPDGEHVVTVDIDDNARLWDVRDSRPAHSISRQLGQMGVTKSAVFSSDGQGILTASVDGVARIWDGNGTLIGSLGHNNSPLKQALFVSQTKQIITAAEDGIMRVWSDGGRLVDDLNTGEVRLLIISPDDASKVVTILTDGSAVLWDRQEKNSIPLEHDARVTHAVFSPDGKQILTASIDGVARLWNLKGECLAKLDKHHRKEIKSAVFSPDGRSILTAARDNTVKLWWTPRTIFDWLKHANVNHLTEKEEKEFGVSEGN